MLYSFDVSANFKKSYDTLNYIKVGASTYYYKGKRTIQYNYNNKSIIKDAYIYTNASVHLAIFDPYLLIPIGPTTTPQYWPLYYWNDYVAYESETWDSDNYMIEPDAREDFINTNAKTGEITPKPRTVSWPTHLFNESSYLEIGTYLYRPMIPATETGYTLNNTMYQRNIHSWAPLATQTYDKSGNYVYKFTYIAPPDDELNAIYYDTSNGFGPYHHSRSTDFFSIRLCNKLYTNEKSLNIISLRTYNLHYVNTHKHEFCSGKSNRTYSRDTVIDDYPQFIDGEEYTFSFSLYIGDDGIKLSNCSLSGRLKNAASKNQQIPMFKVEIPNEIGNGAKVSLMHNSEIFLSQE